LLYCPPAYRNLLLAGGVRIVGLAYKIGAGINIIMNTVLRGGFDLVEQWGPPDAWDRINVQGTRCMLGAAQQAGTRRSASGGWMWIDHGQAVTSTTHIENLVDAIDLALTKR
jgi:hypothetical protein